MKSVGGGKFGFGLERRDLAHAHVTIGLAVPGMPVGSPGMEVGDQRMPYETLLFNGEEATTYARHGE